jgi:hypothetical protein
LDLLFPLIKLRRRDVIRFEENESASDEDYWKTFKIAEMLIGC